MPGLPPGIWDQIKDQFDVNDGTMCRTPSPIPGRLCLENCSSKPQKPSVVDQPRETVSRIAVNAANVLQKNAKIVAADSFYIFSHEVVQIRVANPLYGKVKNAPEYVSKYIEFGPAGGLGDSLLNAILILAGVPIKGEVTIRSSYEIPWWLKWLQFGHGYEGLLDQSTALQLDPAKGERILKRAEELKIQAAQGRYLYLVTDKAGPILGSTVMESKAKNCIGFVSDLLNAIE